MSGVGGVGGANKKVHDRTRSEGTGEDKRRFVLLIDLMDRSKKISLLISAIIGLNSILNRPPAYFIYSSSFFFILTSKQ